MARADTEDIADHIFKWCVGEGSGTRTAEKLAQLYVSVHLNQSQHTVFDEDDEHYRYLSRAFMESCKNGCGYTKGKESIILSALYDIY